MGLRMKRGRRGVCILTLAASPGPDVAVAHAVAITVKGRATARENRRKSQVSTSSGKKPALPQTTSAKHVLELQEHAEGERDREGEAGPEPEADEGEGETHLGLGQEAGISSSMVQLGAVGEMDVGEKQKCENWLDYPNADFWLGDLCDIPLGDIVAGWARNGMEDHASPLWAKNMEMRVGNVNPQNFAPVAGAGAGRPGTTATHKNDRAFVARQAVKCVNALRMLGEWLMLTGLLARNSNAAKYAVRQTILAQKYGQSRVAVSMHVGGVFAPLTGRPALVPEYFTGELATMNLEWLCKGLCDKVDTCVAYTFSTQDHPGAPLRCWLKGGRGTWAWRRQ